MEAFGSSGSKCRWKGLFIGLMLGTFTLAAAAALAVAETAAESAAASAARIAADAEYLASDETEGRGVGTRGIDLAADYIARQFAEAGLATALFDGQPHQQFVLRRDAQLGDPQRNRLALIGPPDEAGRPQRIELALHEQFTPLAIGGSASFDAPLVFAGYGITADEAGYDDFADLDVKGKAVLLIRKEPRQNHPESRFAGRSPSQHATFERKVANAVQRGAAVVVIVNDAPELARRREATAARREQTRQQLVQAEAQLAAAPDDAGAADRVEKLRKQMETFDERLEADQDQLLGVREAGTGGDRDRLPVVFARRSAFDPVLQSVLGADLAALERKIDEGLKPASAPLAPWRLQGETHLERKDTQVKNVLGVLEGKGPTAEETIVVGAHYDHLGLGGPGALGERGVIYHGADDNASGTAVVIELARRLALRPQALPRRVVFIAFTAEESGLWGSRHYVENPLFPLDKTVAMLNFDMVGRLRDDKLYLMGIGSAAEFEPLLSRLGERHGLDLVLRSGSFGGSDHQPFHGKRIPVIHFFTGMHGDYHRPSDTFDKLNIEGMRRVTDLAEDLLVALATAEHPPTFQPAERQQGAAVAEGGRPFLGTTPDFDREVDGYAVLAIVAGSPADKAGMAAGDVVVRLGDAPIGSLQEIDAALRQHKPGDEVELHVLRDGEEIKLRVVLGPPQ